MRSHSNVGVKVLPKLKFNGVDWPRTYLSFTHSGSREP
jgi:hypothetical protein